MPSELAPIRDGIDALRRGEVVIVVDGEKRENEGDFVVAAEHVTAEVINFMARHGRGLICATLPHDRLRELEILPMVASNSDPHGTAFHVSVDHRATGTGISASDRAVTVRALIDGSSGPDDFRRPGHVFPLAARRGGVLERPGHTEASIDLTVAAGLTPGAVICEIASADGEMARLPELLEMGCEHGMQVIAIADLIEHRRRHEQLVTRVAEASLPATGGEFVAIGYQGVLDGREHLALTLGDVAGSRTLAHVHVECLAGDVFSSLGCDCRRLLDGAQEAILAAGRGVVLYLRADARRRIPEDWPACVPGAHDDALAVQMLADLGVRAPRWLTADSLQIQDPAMSQRQTLMTSG